MDDSLGINLSETFAPIYWGTGGFLVSLLLTGITIVQAYMFFPHSNDRSGVKLIAAFMLISDLVSSILVAQSVYYYLIPHFGSLIPLSSITPEISADCLLSTLITFISQMYFVHQLYSVKKAGNGSNLIIVTIAVFAMLAFAGGIGCVATMYIFNRGVLANRNKYFSIFFGLAKAFGAITDIIATAAMCVFLKSAKTGMRQTNSLIKTLVQWVLQRGILVTFIQTALVISFYAAPTKLYWFAFHVNVTKLYANTFYAMLNGRSQLKDRKSVITSSRGQYPSGNGKHPHLPNDHHQQQVVHDISIDMGSEESDSNQMPMVTKTVVISSNI
ncbi:hypothetical protein AMATHDRAFT_194576 [Amanita thiersii Skay4041]|uniref:DUF6534 domain-containing protein n=1 Tax=Amanita thiersii Skay4041 TaxID=703135 RepID=A0A2A9NPI4_9AGAR|nr:hypothetical protein AMATHDRAFT_194576 [Amanita thiersii Skay4041]